MLPGYVLIAVSIGAILGLVTVLLAAQRFSKRLGGPESPPRNDRRSAPDAVDPTPQDVSVELSHWAAEVEVIKCKVGPLVIQVTWFIRPVNYSYNFNNW